MDTNTVIALVSVVVGGVGGILGCLRFVTSTADAVRKECADNLKEGLKGEAHARSNAIQPTTTWLGRMEAEMSDLQRDTVRRADFAGLDARLTRLDTKMDLLPDRMDAKLESIMRRIEGARP